jgi:hypothetical protein
MNRNISFYILKEMRKRTEKEGSVSSVLSRRRGIFPHYLE